MMNNNDDDWADSDSYGLTAWEVAELEREKAENRAWLDEIKKKEKPSERNPVTFARRTKRSKKERTK